MAFPLLVRKHEQAGLTLVEVVVIVVVIAVVFLLVLLSAPRNRETARAVGCQKNLREIGVAVVLYDQSRGRLPTVPVLPPPGREPDGPSPLGAMLGELGLEDFQGLQPGREPVRGPAGLPPEPRRVPGFLCPSDPNTRPGLFPAPVSYRATTGDTADGRHGPFAPGGIIRLDNVEAADGVDFTAAFAERLLGTGKPNQTSANYALVAGPLGMAPCSAAPSSAWRGDAGSSWAHADWRSTLYNHALAPNEAGSCLARDGGSARIGASSGHVRRVHVLVLGGAVRPYTTSTDPAIWRALATTGLPSAAQEPAQGR